jgi:hypothetical protein
MGRSALYDILNAIRGARMFPGGSPHFIVAAHSPSEPSPMPELSMLIGEYCSILEQERQLKERKEQLKEAISEAMMEMEIPKIRSQYGSATLSPRFKLSPRKGAVLDLLTSEDLYRFAQFTPGRVKELLVPKYGRDALLPLFDIERSVVLTVQRPRSTHHPDRDHGADGPTDY